MESPLVIERETRTEFANSFETIILIDHGEILDFPCPFDGMSLIKSTLDSGKERRNLWVSHHRKLVSR